MTVAYDASYRPAWPTQSSPTALCLEDKFEILKEIGDGSFGSVALARVRSAGANIARRGTLVAVKTMKKTFDTFNHCLELREVIFLRSLPAHPHLVPALDIFLDPMSKKLHIAMEYMDGNLYQLMKSREHKCLDAASVKSILFQIISGLEHIHQHNFFHRDIKPENILVSTSAPQDTASTFKRYSALVTPPSTPPAYTIKIADFGLARETHSKLPYTTYVSTRWYRAPEVLLRAGEYSAPVDIWAVGAMAVEVATLKPLFPGGNEVDQVWRICEIMGSPGNWQNRHGAKVGGGEWKEGVKLAQKLGFSFPKMAPHTLDTILRPPQWPASLSDFVTWCLMWDPKNRPTSSQALAHDYFKDALDPLRPKSSSRLLGSRKQSSASTNDSFKDASESIPSLTSKTSSWFRKSLIQREVSAPSVPQHSPAVHSPSPVVQVAPSPAPAAPAPPAKPTADPNATVKARPAANKRATWTNGLPSNAAPIPILPTIRPISPLSDAVTAQATVRPVDADDKTSKKIGRQLSTNSQTNHYAEIHRQEAERALNGQSGLASPVSGHRESFFSHLRKRARRFSGKYQAPMSPNSDDIEANAGCAPWGSSSNRQSMVIDSQGPVATSLPSNDFSDLDKALQNVRRSLEASSQATGIPTNTVSSPRGSNQGSLKRQHSVPRAEQRPAESTAFAGLFGRSRSTRNKHQPSLQYETPDEEDELLDEALNSAHKAARRLDRHTKQEKQYTTPKYPPVPHVPSQVPPSLSYLTPSPSADRSIGYDYFKSTTKPVDILKPKGSYNNLAAQWPTPPSDSEWAASAAASIFAAGAAYR